MVWNKIAQISIPTQIHQIQGQTQQKSSRNSIRRKSCRLLSKCSMEKTESLPPEQHRPKIFGEEVKFKTGDFTIEELFEIIRKLPKNKTPGPDGIITELIAWLVPNNRTTLLKLLNRALNENILEEEMHHASVASIFKKGDPAKLENYRPISLLETTYKLFAGIC